MEGPSPVGTAMAERCIKQVHFHLIRCISRKVILLVNVVSHHNEKVEAEGCGHKDHSNQNQHQYFEHFLFFLIHRMWNEFSTQSNDTG